LYPFNGRFLAKDTSRNRNPPALFRGVRYVTGPDGFSKSAIYFSGRSTSYVQIPNNGCLDTERSITIMMWVWPESAGPIFHYNPGGWGVHFWMTARNKLFVRFVGRRRKNVHHVESRAITPGQWNFVTTTYNGRTGLATLWKSGVPLAQRFIGRFSQGLDTNTPVRIGAKIGDRRYFRGKIACVQVFRRALNGGEIKSRMKTCWQGKSNH